ncbi:MAG: deoxyribodipyrimidine photolyase, partial [Cytophagales bacterium]|nr:deoxyribodipyrimidine photolyase [Cytophagales bacterium]
MFPTDLKSIYQRIEQIDPMAYAQTRNYVDGKVTRLSPYISRGVISTKQVAESLLRKGYELNQLTSILQELAWRDYFQLVWIEKGDQLNDDLKHPQSPVSTYGIPTSVLEAKSGISAIDDAIRELYDTGYLHNHLRMYTAAIVCNLANSHWKNPSQWMY